MKNLKFTLALIIGLAISSNTIQAQTKPEMPEDRKVEMANQLKMDKEKLALSKDQEASYMEISKKYGTVDSAAFVNGILDQIVKH